mgnify:CR=1 FL=1
MYPQGGAEPLDDYPQGGGSFPSNVGFHLEGFIPIILVIIILLFLAIRFDVIDSNTPVIGPLADLFEGSAKPSQMLILGATSQEVIDTLNQNDDLVRYVIRTPESLTRSPREILSQYDIVMLDQSQEANKEVAREVGEEIQRYVNTGGKLIVVLDSGIRRPGAFDVIGWENTFGDIVPVSCDRIIEEIPVCLNRLNVRGKLYSVDDDHPIMRGIPVFPAQPGFDAVFEVFDVSPLGKELAFIQDPYTKKSFPAVVEKPSLVGKSIYFNYNPGITRGIFESTLRYLK